jgi:hypothetical protein
MSGPLLFALFSLIALVIFIFALARSREKSRFQVPANIPPAAGDKYGICLLLDALDKRDRNERVFIIDTLTQLLPRLHASDAENFSAEHLRKLYAALNATSVDYSDAFTRAFDPPIMGDVVDRSELLDFHLAILKALEQIGDETAIPHVSAIIERRAFREADKILHDAAVDCFPTLLARIEGNRSGSMLLRPSSGLAKNGETLLRPARQGEVHLEFLLHVPEEEGKEEEKAEP